MNQRYCRPNTGTRPETAIRKSTLGIARRSSQSSTWSAVPTAEPPPTCGSSPPRRPRQSRSRWTSAARPLSAASTPTARVWCMSQSASG
ncbi:hypothetical protein [Micromonospora sp. NPDC005305]|uniref:hypothetical protein n=1 Tax=Micromonospora sp. NPDC005305 TaxID=3156875 RepID=UPI0033B6C745